ncbi:MAG: ABC transporter ATP-binding protein [Oligoflexia bacterium]|nr:ABC transporter ATP-binding protein [Oligoflexia bacterium]
MSEFAIQMREVSKSYAGFNANKKVNFNLKHGSIHAIAGENGAGKSTLMKVLFGLTKPNSGEILINGEKKSFKSPLEAIASGIGMVQQHFALSGVISALENIILGAEPQKFGFINHKEALTQLTQIAKDNLNVPWERETNSLPIGEHQRIEILKLLFRKAKILILDEPTGVLTPKEVKRFFELLKNLKAQGHSIVIITHKLDEIFELCDEVTVLRRGQVTGHFKVSSITKDDLVQAMIGRRLKNLPKEKSFAQNDAPSVLKVQNLLVSKPGRGKLSGISFQIKPGEILGVAGVEGNGQQTLVEALLELEKYSGQIFFESKNTKNLNVRRDLNYGLISEDRHHQSLWLDESVANNSVIGLSSRFLKNCFLNFKAVSEFSEKVLKKYDVSMQNVQQKVSGLSGGNQQKVIIAREIDGRAPKLLIASQPTRGVDVGAIESIHESIISLAQNGSGILLISSELEEICKLSDRVIVLRNGEISAEFMGPQYDTQKIGEAMV